MSTRRVTVWIDEEVWKKTRQHALEHDVTAQMVVEVALRQWLDIKEEPNAPQPKKS